MTNRIIPYQSFVQPNLPPPSKSNFSGFIDSAPWRNLLAAGALATFSFWTPITPTQFNPVTPAAAQGTGAFFDSAKIPLVRRDVEEAFPAQQPFTAPRGSTCFFDSETIPPFIRGETDWAPITPAQFNPATPARSQPSCFFDSTNIGPFIRGEIDWPPIIPIQFNPTTPANLGANCFFDTQLIPPFLRGEIDWASITPDQFNPPTPDTLQGSTAAFFDTAVQPPILRNDFALVVPPIVFTPPPLPSLQGVVSFFDSAVTAPFRQDVIEVFPAQVPFVYPVWVPGSISFFDSTVFPGKPYRQDVDEVYPSQVPSAPAVPYGSNCFFDGKVINPTPWADVAWVPIIPVQFNPSTPGILRGTAAFFDSGRVAPFRQDIVESWTPIFPAEFVPPTPANLQGISAFFDSGHIGPFRQDVVEVLPVQPPVVAAIYKVGPACFFDSGRAPPSPRFDTIRPSIIPAQFNPKTPSVLQGVVCFFDTTVTARFQIAAQVFNGWTPVTPAQFNPATPANLNGVTAFFDSRFISRYGNTVQSFGGEPVIAPAFAPLPPAPIPPQGHGPRKRPRDQVPSTEDFTKQPQPDVKSEFYPEPKDALEQADWVAKYRKAPKQPIIPIWDLARRPQPEAPAPAPQPAAAAEPPVPAQPPAFVPPPPAPATLGPMVPQPAPTPAPAQTALGNFGTQGLEADIQDMQDIMAVLSKLSEQEAQQILAILSPDEKGET